MADLKYLEEEWEREGRFGSRQERMKRAGKWEPYYTWLAERQKHISFNPEEDPTGFISLMREETILRPQDLVLDIGAGTGEYGLRMAGKCKAVTALEYCPACIDVMKQRAKKAGIDNVSFRLCAWEEFGETEQFDFVFTSMCPVICNVEEVKRMERLSKRQCGIVTVLPGSVDSHRRAMMQELDIHPAGMMTNGNRYEAVLKAMGRKPEMYLKSYTSESRMREEEFLERYTCYFGIFGFSGESLQRYLQRYFETHAKDGVLREESHMNMVLLSWNV